MQKRQKDPSASVSRPVTSDITPSSTTEPNVDDHTSQVEPRYSATTVTFSSVSTITIGPGVTTQTISTSVATLYSQVAGSASNEPNTIHSGVGGGVVAGVAIGCLIVGAILASLLLTIFFGKRVKKMERKWISEREQFESMENSKTLYYVPTAIPQPNQQDIQRQNELKEAKQRIKQLEQERNAASQFGDTLDRHSEQELLTSSTFGLLTFDQTLKQAVMALAVNASGHGQSGGANSANTLTRCSPDQIQFLRNCKPNYAKENFENVLLHLINGFLFEKVCVPFSPYIKVSQDNLLDSLYSHLQATYDQAVVARWRCLTQTALRSNKKSTDSSEDVLLTELNELIVQILVWSGMDDVKSAQSNVQQNKNRLRNAVVVLLSLIDVLHEEMASNNYELYMANKPALTKTFGITAQSGRQTSKVRVLSEVVTA